MKIPKTALNFGLGVVAGILLTLVLTRQTTPGTAPEPTASSFPRIEKSDRLRFDKRDAQSPPAWQDRLHEAARETGANPPTDNIRLPGNGASLTSLTATRLSSLGLEGERLESAVTLADQGFAQGNGEPLAAGSELDQWVRGLADPELTERWDRLLAEHRADVVERRSNSLLTSLQRSVSLSPDQKDALYPALVDRSEREFGRLVSGEYPEEQVMANWIEEAIDSLSPALPPNRHEMLVLWAETTLPEFWDSAVSEW